MKRILIIHGPNLQFLGRREPHWYGDSTLKEVNQQLYDWAQQLNLEIRIEQRNGEGEIIDILAEEQLLANGLILNAGALTHYGYSLHDAILAMPFPTIEVHFSQLKKRTEAWRHTSVLSSVCRGSISGFGAESYFLAMKYFSL